MVEANAKKILKTGLLSIFFIFIIIYAFFRSHDLIFGVKIKDVKIDGLPPHQGETLSKSVLNITGNAKNAINLTLNGREISVDQAGNWSETIALLVGYNIITIKARDKFDYSDEKNYQLIFQP